MRVFHRFMILLLLSMGGVLSLTAQELNAVVKVNSSKIQGTNRAVFTSLEEALYTFINGRRWSDMTSRDDDKIDCTFTLVITEAVATHSFRGELYVQSRRAVRDATFATPLLNVRDRQFDFDYMEYQPLTFNVNDLRGNLTATIAYYVYLILGLDQDSRYPSGGTPFFRQMERIAATVQPYGWSGWDRYGNERSRMAMAAAFNEGSLAFYRQMWYEYHVQGVDELSRSADRGPERMASAAAVIASLHAERPTSVLITLFGDAKLDELVNVLSRGRDEQRQKAYEVLKRVYPSRMAELDKLR